MEHSPGIAGVVVICGSEPAMLDLVLDAVAPETELTVLFVADRPPAVSDARTAIVDVRDRDAASAVLEPGTWYAGTVDQVRALVEPFGDRVVALLFPEVSADQSAVSAAVRRAGGTTFGLNPWNGRANATPPVLVDAFIEPRELREMLLEALGDPLGAAAMSDDEQLRRFLDAVRHRTGIDFSQYKMTTIRRRLQRLMVAAGTATIGEYAKSLQANAGEYQRLVRDFLIKVTEFFRDDEIFEYIRDEIVPELIERARADRRTLRFWSAGCATGEEAYSLAILVAELLGPALGEFDVKIFATDLDEHAVAFARAGVYPRQALAALPPAWIEKYFVETMHGFEVRKRIRNLTIFGQHDLGQRAPFPRIDLVLCRNVLIYFTKEFQLRTLQAFAFSLREGGYLVLGKSETLSAASASFRPVHMQFKIFRRFGERVLAPARRSYEPFGASPDRQDTGERAGAGTRGQPARAGSESGRAGTAERFGKTLVAARVGLVLVDRRYDILAINTEARRLLGIFGLGVNDDLLHQLRGPADDLRVLLDAALAGEEISGRIVIEDGAAGGTRTLLAVAYPEPVLGETVSPGVVLRVEDVSAAVRERGEFDHILEERERDLERLNRQNGELLKVQRTLADANHELSTANVELRSRNEHLLISVEEAESSSEEVETVNEEMQATNEELETLNEELQATIEELNTTNDELHTRSLDLHPAGSAARPGRISRRERELWMAFTGLPVPIVQFDAEGATQMMNDAFLALLEAYGDPLPLVGAESAEALPLRRAAQGATFEERWRLDDGTRTREFMLVAKRLSSDGDGTLVTMIEIAG